MPAKTFILRGRGEPQTLRIEGRAGSWEILRDGGVSQALSTRLPDGRLSILLPDARQICGRVLPRGRGFVEVSTARGACRLALADLLHDRVDHAASSTSKEEAEEQIRALMPGRVVEVAATAGDQVQAGTLLLVLEAMKMQNEIRAERAGTVLEVQVKSGEAVEAGKLMMTVQATSETAG